MEKYIPLLLQIRLLADQHNDTRSLVAIAAKFERDADSHLAAMAASLNQKGHHRNEGER